MLEVRLNKEETMVNINGCMSDILSDLTLLCRIIHEKLEGEAKEGFEYGLEFLVNKKIYAKTEKEMDELVKENREQFIKKQEEELKDLLKDMPKDLLKMLKDILK